MRIIRNRNNQWSAGGNVEQIIHQYKDMVYRIIMVRVKNPWDADDIFQEVFLTYFRKKPSFHEEEHRKAWLIRTTMNLTKKWAGSSWKQRVDVVERIEELPIQFVFESKEETQIFSAMRRLSEKYQNVLYLFYFEEMSTKEVAEVLGIREGAVRTRLSRAREQLKEEMQKEGDVYE